MDLRRLFAHKALENQKTLPVTPKGEPWVPGACWQCALPVTQKKRLTYTYVSVHSSNGRGDAARSLGVEGEEAEGP